VTWENAVNGMAMFNAFALAADPVNPSHVVLQTGDEFEIDAPVDPQAYSGASEYSEPANLPASYGTGGANAGKDAETHAVVFGDATDGNLYTAINAKYGSPTGGGVYARPNTVPATAGAQPGTVWGNELGYNAAADDAACIGLYFGRQAGTAFLLAAAQGGGIYRATYSGGTWTWQSGPATGSAGIGSSGAIGQFIPFTSGGFTAAHIWVMDLKAGQLYYSGDYGQTWALVFSTNLKLNSQNGFIAANPSTADEVWLSSGDNPDGLYQLTTATSTTQIGVHAQSGTSVPANPGGLAWWKGSLYVVDITNSVIAQYTPGSPATWQTLYSPELGDYLSSPGPMAITTDGAVAVSTGYNAAVCGWLPAAVTAPLTLTATLPAAVPGTAYNGALAAAGGTGSYTFALTAGTLPAGIQLDTTGSVTGVAGTLYGTVALSAVTETGLAFKVTDAIGDTATLTGQSITVSNTLVITGSVLPVAVQGAAYSSGGAVAAGVAGGTRPYTYAVTTGTLPGGLFLDGDGSVTGTAGNIYGTPAAQTTTPDQFTITVTDSATPTHATAHAVFTLSVTFPPLTATPAQPPVAFVGIYYSWQLTATGGQGSDTWQIVQGTLPPWASLSPSGLIYGTPSQPGQAEFVAQVTDTETPPASSSTPVLTLTTSGGRPVTASFLATLAASHAIAVGAVLCESFQTGVTPAGIPLPVMPGSAVTLDVTSQTRGTATVNTDGTGWNPRPGANPLQPYGNEIFLRRGVQVDGSVQWLGLGYYKIMQVVQGQVPDGPLAITTADRMQAVIDAQIPAPIQFGPADSVADVFTELIGYVYPAAVINYDWAASADLLGTALTTAADRYGFLNTLALSRGKIMYWDYQGYLQVKSLPGMPVAPPWTAQPVIPVWTVNAGPGGVLTSAQPTLTRSGIYNAVIVTSDGASSSGPPLAIAYDNNPASPTYYYGPFGKVPVFWSDPSVVTASQAAQAAVAMLVKSIALPTQVPFTCIPNPALDTLDAVRLVYPGAGGSGQSAVMFVENLTIPLDAATAMTGTAYLNPALIGLAVSGAQLEPPGINP